jgi:flagellar biosynthesis component FlhA
MNKTVLAAMIAAALALAGMQHDHALAQAPAAKEATDKADVKAGKASERKAKAEERKAKRDEAKKERGEKKAKASAARAAVRERQKQCGAEWRQARKDGKVEKGMTWPKFWSACNTRLKPKAG